MLKNTLKALAKHALLLMIFYLITFSALASLGAAKGNRIIGMVVDVETGEPLIGTNIRILSGIGGTVTDSTGSYVLRNLKEGIYRLQVSHIGYETKIIDSLYLAGDDIVTLNIELNKEPVSIRGVTVTPGQFTIMGDEPESKQILTREVIETRPQLSEDLFRAVQRLPGIAYNDFSAKFNVRGGEQDEVLINLDGMEIYEPFHLKDVDGGVISVTDVAAVEGVDLMTGGYPANYGDRMSGVFNIKTKNPATDHNRVSVGLSLMNARFLGEGTFSDKRGSWLVSARRGYLDLVLSLLGRDDQVRPRYYDLFSKVRYRLNNKQILTASFLRADDDLEFLGEQTEDENNEGDTLLSAYGNTYFWLTLDSYMSSKVIGKTITSIGTVDHRREGQIFDEVSLVPEMSVSDVRSFDLLGLKSDWEYEVGKNFLLKAGLDFKHVSADYDYKGYLFDYIYQPGWIPPYQLLGIDSNIVAINPDGDKFSTYLSNRIRLTRFLTGELGLRYDYTSYSLDDHVSPRANLAVNLSQNTSLRLAWGHFYQVERIDEISVQDGET
ncbi:MAG: TonB-dependent receptor, partial [candidate division Zixibacteria bacterium]